MSDRPTATTKPATAKATVTRARRPRESRRGRLAADAPDNPGDAARCGSRPPPILPTLPARLGARTGAAPAPDVWIPCHRVRTADCSRPDAAGGAPGGGGAPPVQREQPESYATVCYALAAEL